MEIEYFSHQHPLILSDKNGLGRPCSVCGEPVFRGERYSCSRSTECKEEVLIHKSCGEMEKEIQHPFHPRHPLILRSRSPYFPERFNCDACRESGSKFVYHCAECKFDLHVNCASLMPTFSYGGHHHRLTLFENQFGVTQGRLCVGCYTPCRFFFLRCVECDFNIHKSCAANLPKHVLHPLHPLHTLTLIKDFDGYIGCGACHDTSFLSFYFNCNVCNFQLCEECYLRVANIKYSGHHHLLTLFPKFHHIPFIKDNCDTCHTTVRDCGFMFRCVECNFNLHLQCLPNIPPTIKHDCHVDPITLTESVVETYCDACEQERNTHEYVYYCAECPFVAEIKCVIDEILPSLAVENAPKVVEVSTDITFVKLEKEIAKVRSEMSTLATEQEQLTAKLEKLATKLELLEGKRAQYLESKKPSLSEGLSK